MPTTYDLVLLQEHELYKCFKCSPYKLVKVDLLFSPPQSSRSTCTYVSHVWIYEHVMHECFNVYKQSIHNFLLAGHRLPFHNYWKQLR